MLIYKAPMGSAAVGAPAGRQMPLAYKPIGIRPMGDISSDNKEGDRSQITCRRRNEAKFGKPKRARFGSSLVRFVDFVCCPF